MGRLSGKSAVVSGGASGIGKAIAQLFLEEGAKVVIADINGALLEKTAKELAVHGPGLGVAGDVRSMADAGADHPTGRRWAWRAGHPRLQCRHHQRDADREV